MANNNDFIIINDTGQRVRLDIQEALQQLASNNFGTNPPVTNEPNETPVQIAFPHQWFANGDTGKLMYKDATNGNDANTNYFNLANLTGGIFVDQPSTFNGDVTFQGTSSFGTHKITFDADFNNGKSALKFARETKAVFGNDELFIGVDLPFATVINSSTTSLVIVGEKTTAQGSDFCIQLKTQRGDASGQDLAYEAIQDGGQKLYFDGGGTPKLQTTADGITVHGLVHATAQPACLLIDPVNTVVTSTNESTPIQFNTQQTNVGCTVNTAKDRITVPFSGTYLISVCLSGHENVETVGTDRLFKILKNGSDAVDKNAFPRDARSRVDDGFSDVINMPLSLNANDYLELCFEEVGLGNFEVEFGYFSVTKLN